MLSRHSNTLCNKLQQYAAMPLDGGQAALWKSGMTRGTYVEAISQAQNILEKCVGNPVGGCVSVLGGPVTFQE